MINEHVLITGATGFLGTQLVRRILAETKQKIIVLVRGEKLSATQNRLKNSWWDYPELIQAIDSRIQVIPGEITKIRLGMSEVNYQKLVEKVDYIIHAAAELDLAGDYHRMAEVNVEGTRRVLEFAGAVKARHGLKRLSYISTAYVAGKRRGVIWENELTNAFGFNNNYELTKYEAEKLVATRKNELPISIFRPGMIIGDSQTGRIKKFNTLYFPLRLYLTGKIKFMPVRRKMKVNLVPVDYVAEAIFKLTFLPKAEGLTFHLTLPPEKQPTVKELLLFVKNWAQQNLQIDLPRVWLFPLPILWLKFLKRLLPRNSLGGKLLMVAPYLLERRSYRLDNTEKFLAKYAANWQDFLPPILSYATDKNFLHSSERTVFEQILFRLDRQNRPVVFRDLKKNSWPVTIKGEQIKQDILKVAAALQTFQIHPGDRVALLGLNSSKYFMMDVALGLIGAVSVPLYYTSPVAEIVNIIHDAKAQLLLVGKKELLVELVEQLPDLTIITFCQKGYLEEWPEKVIEWKELMEIGTEAILQEEKITFYKPATIRYTSGSTGEPKGAVFNQAQLRWLAQIMGTITPWQLRNQKIIYLSYLPLNHVAEGILANYALYYLPAPLEVYFLEDFHQLAKKLPQVRPTVFFSVPRFYEKLWEKVEQSWLGKIYLGCKSRFWQKFWGRILRQGILKKAGLDRCGYLLVGSAPSNPDLLTSFRKMGIEVHNAYGLTEAPLITINKAGANYLETVGQELPETKVKIATDGEVLVKGPQVMIGYWGAKSDYEPRAANQWLPTGDLGEFTAEGFLKIIGRKKEIIINAYGKNIYPLKIEFLLKKIAVVKEALVVGEGRPFVAALFWVADCRNEKINEVLEREVQRVNEELAPVEQIKKWAVLSGELSIANGELTANLKIKRGAVLTKYQAIVAALYGNLCSVNQADEAQKLGYQFNVNGEEEVSSFE